MDESDRDGEHTFVGAMATSVPGDHAISAQKTQKNAEKTQRTKNAQRRKPCVVVCLLAKVCILHPLTIPHGNVKKDFYLLVNVASRKEGGEE